jgi:hypothetical protein
LLVALSLAAFAVVLLNALGLFADLHFVLPVALRSCSSAWPACLESGCLVTVLAR